MGVYIMKMSIILLLTVHVSLGLGAITIQKSEQNIFMYGSYGRDVTLVCTVDPLVDVVSWKSSLILEDLTNCDYQSEYCSDDVYRGFTFTADYVNKTYTMTIPQMTWKDNVNYTCRQGNGESITELFEVEGVLLVDRPTITDNKDTKKIEETTGCIYPESQFVVKWYILMDDNSTEEYTPRNVTRSLSSTGCEGKAKFIQSSFTLTDPTSNLIKAVKFFATVEHLLIGMTWKSDCTQHYFYIDEDKVTANNPTDNSGNWWILIYIFATAGMIVGISIISIYKIKIVRRKLRAVIQSLNNDTRRLDKALREAKSEIDRLKTVLMTTDMERERLDKANTDKDNLSKELKKSAAIELKMTETENWRVKSELTNMSSGIRLNEIVLK